MSAANRCGERFGNDFRAIRKILDDFNPDLVLMWGDDQYENFREDIVPAFCLLGYEADFTFGQAFQFYAFGASMEAFTAGNPDQELSAVAALSTVPEPGSLLLGSLAVGGLALRMLRRRRG